MKSAILYSQKGNFFQMIIIFLILWYIFTQRAKNFMFLGSFLPQPLSIIWRGHPIFPQVILNFNFRIMFNFRLKRLKWFFVSFHEIWIKLCTFLGHKLRDSRPHSRNPISKMKTQNVNHPFSEIFCFAKVLTTKTFQN